MAVHLGDEVWAHAASCLRPGVTEREVAWEAQRYAYEHGADGMAFETHHRRRPARRDGAPPSERLRESRPGTRWSWTSA